MRVEWLILADYAEIVGNKLYLVGGGWDVLTVNSDFPVQRQCGVAASFRVPWNETNQPHNIAVEIQTDDGVTLAQITGEFKVGRPAQIPPGQEQRSQLAGNIGLRLEKPGTYVIVARVEGQEAERVHFNVVEGPVLRMKKQAAEGAA